MIWGVSFRIIISWNIWIGQKWKRVRSNTVGMRIMVYDSKVWFGYCKTLLKSLLRHLPCYVAACIFLPVHLYLISFDSISHFQLYWNCLIFTFCGLAYLASDAFSGNRNSFRRSGENAVKHDSFRRSGENAGKHDSFRRSARMNVIKSPVIFTDSLSDYIRTMYNYV